MDQWWVLASETFTCFKLSVLTCALFLRDYVSVPPILIGNSVTDPAWSLTLMVSMFFCVKSILRSTCFSIKCASRWAQLSIFLFMRVALPWLLCVLVCTFSPAGHVFWGPQSDRPQHHVAGPPSLWPPEVWNQHSLLPISSSCPLIGIIFWGRWDCLFWFLLPLLSLLFFFSFFFFLPPKQLHLKVYWLLSICP